MDSKSKSDSSAKSQTNSLSGSKRASPVSLEQLEREVRDAQKIQAEGKNFLLNLEKRAPAMSLNSSLFPSTCLLPSEEDTNLTALPKSCEQSRTQSTGRKGLTSYP